MIATETSQSAEACGSTVHRSYGVNACRQRGNAVGKDLYYGIVDHYGEVKFLTRWPSTIRIGYWPEAQFPLSRPMIIWNNVNISGNYRKVKWDPHSLRWENCWFCQQSTSLSPSRTIRLSIPVRSQAGGNPLVHHHWSTKFPTLHNICLVVAGQSRLRLVSYR